MTEARITKFQYYVTDAEFEKTDWVYGYKTVVITMKIFTEEPDQLLKSFSVSGLCTMVLSRQMVTLELNTYLLSNYLKIFIK
jgi:hypothetical protein